MTLKFYFTGLVFLLVASVAVFVYTLFSINPFEAGTWQLISFYTSLFLVAFATFTLFGYVIRVWLSRNNPLKFFARVSARQGALFAVLVVVLMYLQSLRSLSVLAVILLVTSLLLLELAFLTR